MVIAENLSADRPRVVTQLDDARLKVQIGMSEGFIALSGTV